MKKVLFVCLGNICRSPSAEGIMNAFIEEEHLEDEIQCDSAGTYAFHAGENADTRMQKHALKRDYHLTSISRKVIDDDFIDFDYIIAMDNSNYANLLEMNPYTEHKNKIYKMVDFCKNKNANEVPDPYYGGDQGFENVLDIIEDGVEGLIEKIRG